MKMRSQQNEIRGIHKWPLIGALAMVVLALTLVTASVLTRGPASATANTATVADRMLYVVDSGSGKVSVYDAKTREQLGTFGRGEGAFLRISMRSLMRQRTLKQVALTLPFKLVRNRRGDLIITDPHSGDTIRVNAFGP